MGGVPGGRVNSFNNNGQEGAASGLQVVPHIQVEAAPSSTFALIKPPNSYPTHQILQTFPNISKPRQPCPFLSHPSKSRQTHFLSKFDSTPILDLPFPTIPDPPDPAI